MSIEITIFTPETTSQQQLERQQLVEDLGRIIYEDLDKQEFAEVLMKNKDLLEYLVMRCPEMITRGKKQELLEQIDVNVLQEALEEAVIRFIQMMY